ncbi:hydrogen peroxide-inducible genes activator [Sulfitobacter sp. JB4-11]|uniref:hydrogen peroxide-inducible genes activator n=1 Tax=Sulfitobacter rhodophyticola TaxID=3238304 RepID=UPI003514346A
MANFTLKQLRYFEALAQQQHFGRAAEMCAISQPALSVQIKELEQQTGKALFERAARQVRLTAFGEDFATRVRALLRQADDLGAFAAAARERLAGRFRLGVIPTVAPYLLPGLVPRLSAEFPDLELRLRESQTARLVEELLQGRLDAALVALPIEEPSLSETVLFSEEFVLVRPATDAALPVPKVTDLRNMLLLEEGHCLRDQALSFCNRPAGFARDDLDGSSLSTLVQMVGAGLGVTILPQMAVPLETRMADVVCAPFEGTVPGRTIGMVWRRTNPMTQELCEVAQVVRQAADQTCTGAHIQVETAQR